MTDRENCLLVNLSDPKDLADKILELKNDPNLTKKISDAGLNLYKNKLTPKHLAGKILDEISKRFSGL